MTPDALTQLLQTAQANASHTLMLFLAVESILMLAVAAAAVVAALFLLKCGRLVDSVTKAVDMWTALQSKSRPPAASPRPIEAISEAARYGPR